MTEPPRGGRRVRWRGAIGLALRRLTARGAGGAGRQVALSVAGVALAVALVVVVTGVSVGLATETTVRSDAVDYWIVPETGTASTTVVSTRGPQLGAVHGASDRIAAIDGVTHATPVLLELVRLRTADGESARVLLVGVIPTRPPQSIAGLPSGALTPGDPHYANGSYDGPWTGEVVLSAAAAERLDAGRDATLHVNTTGGAAPQPFQVTTVSAGAEGGEPLATLPVALVHLGELQAVTGAADGDLADQLLVATDRPGVRADLAAVYPRSSVVASRSLAAPAVLDAALPRAVAGAAALVALVVGTLFVATTLGLASVADHRLRAVLAAVGVSRGTRRLLVATRTLAVALAGGVVGVVLGAVGIVAANALARATLGVPAVAVLDPLLVAVGLVVAAAIGVLVTPYLWWLDGRSTPLVVLSR